MKNHHKLELEQDEIHTIIKKYFGIPVGIIMESDTNTVMTTFKYHLSEKLVGEKLTK